MVLAAQITVALLQVSDLILMPGVGARFFMSGISALRLRRQYHILSDCLVNPV